MSDIIYIEGYGIYSKLMTNKGKITINDSMMSLEEKLRGKMFIRVHKSFIINTSKISTIKTGSVEMEIGEVPIGNRFKPAIEDFLSNIERG